MTDEERKKYDEDVLFRNAICEHGSQRRKCNICELFCEQYDNAALRARVEDVEGMAKMLLSSELPEYMYDKNLAWCVARAISAWLKEGVMATPPHPR